MDDLHGCSPGGVTGRRISGASRSSSSRASSRSRTESGPISTTRQAPTRPPGTTRCPSITANSRSCERTIACSRSAAGASGPATPTCDGGMVGSTSATAATTAITAAAKDARGSDTEPTLPQRQGVQGESHTRVRILVDLVVERGPEEAPAQRLDGLQVAQGREIAAVQLDHDRVLEHRGPRLLFAGLRRLVVDEQRLGGP